MLPYREKWLRAIVTRSNKGGQKMAKSTTRLGLKRKIDDAAQVLPANFRSHIKASIREAFLAFESLLDEAVKELEKKPVERRATRAAKKKTAPSQK